MVRNDTCRGTVHLYCILPLSFNLEYQLDSMCIRSQRLFLDHLSDCKAFHLPGVLYWFPPSRNFAGNWPWYVESVPDIDPTVSRHRCCWLFAFNNLEYRHRCTVHKNRHSHWNCARVHGQFIRISEPCYTSSTAENRAR